MSAIQKELIYSSLQAKIITILKREFRKDILFSKIKIFIIAAN